MTKMGPNDASGVVWVTSELFSLFFFFYLDTNYVYSIYILYIYYAHDGKGSGDENGPKRRIRRHSGRRMGFFSFYPVFFFLDTN